jgi:hypothetical protein
VYLIFGNYFDQLVNNLPLNIKEIKIFKNKKHLLKKVLFGCKIMDEKGTELFL